MSPFDAPELAEPAGEPQATAADRPDCWCEICGRVALRLADLARLPADLIAGSHPIVCGLCSSCACFHE
jgi:hypothetical protein